MHEIVAGLGRVLCSGASALSLLPVPRCYDYASQRSIGWLALALTVLLPAAWWLLRSR
jgi:hypothetical protein